MSARCISCLAVFADTGSNVETLYCPYCGASWFESSDEKCCAPKRDRPLLQCLQEGRILPESIMKRKAVITWETLKELLMGGSIDTTSPTPTP